MAELSVVQNNNELPEFLVSFDTFWLLYPRKIARKPARDLWQRMTAAQQYAAIVAVTAWRRVWLKRGEIEFIPHARTWLYQERWDDELPPDITVSAASHVPFAAGSSSEPVTRTELPPGVLATLRKLTGRAA